MNTYVKKKSEYEARQWLPNQMTQEERIEFANWCNGYIDGKQIFLHSLHGTVTVLPRMWIVVEPNKVGWNKEVFTQTEFENQFTKTKVRDIDTYKPRGLPYIVKKRSNYKPTGIRYPGKFIK